MDKPSKYLIKKCYKTIYFDYISNTISLVFFKDFLKKEIPKGATDISIGFDEQLYYDDSSVSLKIEWKEKYLNKNYEKQLVKWKKINKNTSK